MVIDFTKLQPWQVAMVTAIAALLAAVVAGMFALVVAKVNAKVSAKMAEQNAETSVRLARENAYREYTLVILKPYFEALENDAALMFAMSGFLSYDGVSGKATSNEIIRVCNGLQWSKMYSLARTLPKHNAEFNTALAGLERAARSWASAVLSSDSTFISLDTRDVSSSADARERLATLQRLAESYYIQAIDFRHAAVKMVFPSHAD